MPRRTEQLFAPLSDAPSDARPTAGPAGRLRRCLTAGALLAAGASAPLASAGDGVVSLSAGPIFDAPVATAAAPRPAASGDFLAAAYEEPAGSYGPAGDSILPAGFVAPRGPRTPFAPAPPAGTVGPSGGPVVPAGYRGGPAYCPPGAQGGYGGGAAPGTAYRAKRGRGGRAGSLWNRLTSYRPPRETFVRFEYLQYAIAGEEVGQVGAEIPGVTTDQTSVLFPFGEPIVNDRSTNDEDSNYTIPFDAPFAPAVVPLLNNFEVEDFQGVRVTFGRPVKNVGVAEFSGFAFSQHNFELDPDVPLFAQTTRADLLSPTGFLGGGPGPTNIAIGFDSNGDESPLLTVFDADYDLTYETEMWGAGARMVFDHLAPDEGFALRPVVGVRYIMLNHNLYQSGTFDNSGTTAPFDRSISTNVHNNYFGPEFGVDAGIRHKWFELGVRPTLTVALNEAQVRTRTVNLVDTTDGVDVATRNFTEFSPVVDVGAYLRVPVGNSIRLNVGYDLLWMARTARPNESTRYNVAVGDDGLPTESLVEPKKSFADTTFNGLNVGVEFIFN